MPACSGLASSILRMEGGRGRGSFISLRSDQAFCPEYLMERDRQRVGTKKMKKKS